MTPTIRRVKIALIVSCLATVSILTAETSETAKPARPEALVFILGDQHSAYVRAAQLLTMIDGIKAEHPALPVAILLNGDTLEYGNILARRSAGSIDFALFAAMARRAPTILNLGNHEPEFYDLAETVRRVEATGVKVIGNIRNHATGQLFAPAATRLKLGKAEATVVGITTDHLSTYRQAVRPSLDLADPVVWAKQNIPALLGSAELPIVLSHAGLKADREILPLVPEGTLFAGAHDHLRFIHPMGRGVYMHSGAWNEFVTLAWLGHDAAGEPEWSVEQRPIPDAGAVDPDMADLIRETREKWLMSEDTAIVGLSPAAMSPTDAALFVTRELCLSADVDAAFIGNTTFGGGLPKGGISRIEFDDCVRFDGTIYVAEIDGARLRVLLGKSNQGADTAFEARTGEYLVASPYGAIDVAKRYRIATTDWGARNTAAYFGEPAIVWREQPGPKLKERVLSALASTLQ